MTQTEKILSYLKDGRGITSLTAYLDLGVTQLAARIFELERAGYVFDKVWIKVKSGKKVVEYSLKYVAPVLPDVLVGENGMLFK